MPSIFERKDVKKALEDAKRLSEPFPQAEVIRIHRDSLKESAQLKHLFEPTNTSPFFKKMLPKKTSRR